MWKVKMFICITYDFFDFTVGRAMFATPFLGEVIGVGLCTIMFGKQGVLYALEAVDFTEQIDGFIPLATFIGIANKP